MLPSNVGGGSRAIRLPSDPLDTSNQPAPTSGTEFAGIGEYWQMAKRRWLLIVGVALLCSGYTFNSVRTERAQFRSKATVRLVDVSRAIAGDMAGSGSMAQQMPFSAGANPIQSQIQILLSEAVVSTAVDLKGLRLIPAVGQEWPREISDVGVSEAAGTASSATATFQPASYTLTAGGRSVTAPYGTPAEVNGIRITPASRPSMASTSFEVISKETAMSRILDNFKVSGREQTDILDMSYTDFEGNEATRIANAMAEAYQVYNATSARQFARRRRTFLETQLKQVDSGLEAANQRYASYSVGRQSSAAVTAAQTATLTAIEGSRLDLETGRRAMQSLLDKIHQPGRSLEQNVQAIMATPAAAANPAIQSIYTQFAALSGTRDQLVGTGTATTNPDLMTLRAQIAVLGKRMVDAADNEGQSIESRLEALKITQSVRGGSSDLSGSQVANAEGLTHEAQLGQDVQTQQKLAADLKGELQKAKMSEAVEAGQVEIVQLARNPGYRIASGTNRKVFLGLVVGLMFGFGAAVLIDSLDRSIRRRGDIEPMLGIPGLVVIPRLPGSAPGRNLIPGMSKRMDRKALEARSRGDVDLVTVTDPRSPSAEAFRTLRTNLMFSQAVDQMRTLVVTSASPGEGKTVTAANLAVSFAQQGMRVLLVDADLRRGRAHRIFSFSREPGLSDFILGYQDEEAVTHQTAVPNLYLISTGKLPPNPAEVLGGAQAKEKFATLTEGYDLVIVDTPPLLAASDAAILATLADGVILVLRAGGTESNAAQQAMQQLRSLGVRIVGAILNDPDSQIAKYGAYYQYNYEHSGNEA